MPKYAFPYFIDRIQHFGKKPVVKAYMSRMRNVYKGNNKWEDFDEH